MSKEKKTKWAIADLHLGQTNCFEWRNEQGKKVRPFASHDDYWEVIKSAWNYKVSPQDKVYILGDLAIKKAAIQLITQLNGHKTLIAGNHDIFSTKLYLDAGIEEVRGVRVFTQGSLYVESPAVILSHIPLALDCVFGKWLNIHGHLHARKLDDDYNYACVSIEQTGFAPVNLEQLVRKVRYQ
jgi:calcineurin-like phosphoesterase family protein